MTLYRKFRLFLRENGCEKAFDEAFYSQCGCNRFDETLSGIVGIDETLFARVFDWRRTPEGRSFWLKISDLWYDQFPMMYGCVTETAETGR